MQLLCDQEHTYGAVLRRAAGTGPGSGGRGDPAALGGTAVLHRMVHYAWDRFGEVGGCECARARACSWGVWVCVRACERQCVCYNIRFSLSPILQLLILRQALDSALLKDCVGEDKKKRRGLLWLLTAFMMGILPSLFKKKVEMTKYSIVFLSPPHPPLFFSTGQNIGMKIPKHRIPWEDLILHEHGKHLKLARYLLQVQQSHDNIPERI